MITHIIQVFNGYHIYKVSDLLIRLGNSCKHMGPCCTRTGITVVPTLGTMLMML